MDNKETIDIFNCENMIKIFEQIINRSDAPIGDEWGCIIPKSTAKQLLDLIKNQKLMIEAQNKNLDEHVWDFCSIGGCEGALPDCWKTCPNSDYNVTKQKAYKEIVEKLKTKKQSSTTIFGEDYDYVDVDDIDKILEEMTADDYAENNKTQS